MGLIWGHIYGILFLGNCPTGWINAVGTNDCYLFARNGPGVTWTQAKYYCISVGGKLAEITDQRSQDFVRRYGDPNIFWWLGGYKASNVSILWDMSNPITIPVISLTFCLLYKFNFPTSKEVHKL